MADIREYYQQISEIQKALRERELHRLNLEKENVSKLHQREKRYEQLRSKIKALHRELVQDEIETTQRVTLLLSQVDSVKREYQLLEAHTERLRQKKHQCELYIASTNPEFLQVTQNYGNLRMKKMSSSGQEALQLRPQPTRSYFPSQPTSSHIFNQPTSSNMNQPTSSNMNQPSSNLIFNYSLPYKTQQLYAPVVPVTSQSSNNQQPLQVQNDLLQGPEDHFAGNVPVNPQQPLEAERSWASSLVSGSQIYSMPNSGQVAPTATELPCATSESSQHHRVHFSNMGIPVANNVENGYEAKDPRVYNTRNINSTTNDHVEPVGNPYQLRKFSNSSALGLDQPDIYNQQNSHNPVPMQQLEQEVYDQQKSMRYSSSSPDDIRDKPHSDNINLQSSSVMPCQDSKERTHSKIEDVASLRKSSEASAMGISLQGSESVTLPSNHHEGSSMLEMENRAMLHKDSREREDLIMDSKEMIDHSVGKSLGNEMQVLSDTLLNENKTSSKADILQSSRSFSQEEKNNHTELVACSNEQESDNPSLLPDSKPLQINAAVHESQKIVSADGDGSRKNIDMSSEKESVDNIDKGINLNISRRNSIITQSHENLNKRRSSITRETNIINNRRNSTVMQSQKEFDRRRSSVDKELNLNIGRRNSMTTQPHDVDARRSSIASLDKSVDHERSDETNSGSNLSDIKEKAEVKCFDDDDDIPPHKTDSDKAVPMPSLHSKSLQSNPSPGLDEDTDSDFFDKDVPVTVSRAYQSLLGDLAAGGSTMATESDSDDIEGQMSILTMKETSNTRTPFRTFASSIPSLRPAPLGSDTDSIDSVEAAIQAAMNKPKDEEPQTVVTSSRETKESPSTGLSKPDLKAGQDIVVQAGGKTASRPQASAALALKLESDSESYGVSGGDNESDDDFDFYD